MRRSAEGSNRRFFDAVSSVARNLLLILIKAETLSKVSAVALVSRLSTQLLSQVMVDLLLSYWSLPFLKRKEFEFDTEAAQIQNLIPPFNFSELVIKYLRSVQYLRDGAQSSMLSTIRG